MSDIWTVKRTLDWCCEYLRKHGDENPRLSTEWLLSAATGMSRLELYTHFDRPLTQGERDVLRETLKRRGAGEPLQYITGEAAFRHIVVKTAPSVLIPRPETEVLVSVVLDWLEGENLLVRQPAAISVAPDEALEAPRDDAELVEDEVAEQAMDEPQPAHVLEVGTGTGCIACSLAREAGAQVLATDISPHALACARSNVDALGLSDSVELVAADCVAGVDGSFDVIVSNPPYIPTGLLEELPGEVARFEPALALDGGEDGLDFFRRLLDEALPLLREGGLLACELHEECLDAAADLAREHGLSDVQVHLDLANRPRILTATM